MRFSFMQIIMMILGLIALAVLVYVLFLVIKALRRYIGSAAVRKEKAENARSLGEVIRQHRTACKMTQEFVAEMLGVSRQAISKWESGVIS